MDSLQFSNIGGNMSELDRIIYKKVIPPICDCTNKPIILSDETMYERYNKVICKMKEEGLDILVIYADVEHGNNFEYLTGFIPRFEEALLVIHQNQKNYMLLGNENLNKAEHARIKAEAIHVPYFSLPNQPMDNFHSFYELIQAAGITTGKQVGVVGWKIFTSKLEANEHLFDVPSYIVDAIKDCAGSNFVVNKTKLMIGEKGVRRTNNPNEILHYEFGASLASDRMLQAMNLLDEGVSEMELGEILNAYGQRNSVVTIAATGERFEKANLYPIDKKVKLQDKISLTVGYKGGLSSRAGYAVNDPVQLPYSVNDYIDVVVTPYYNAIIAWLENIHCGMSGSEMFLLIDRVLPRNIYHWHLCPGHLVADEEWLASPIYDGSKEILESGMLLQTDIIPSVNGYGGTSAESTIALADSSLRDRIKNEYPELWNRIEKRRDYLKNELHINLNEDVLPMCSTLAYLRPCMLDKERAMCVK